LGLTPVLGPDESFVDDPDRAHIFSHLSFQVGKTVWKDSTGWHDQQAPTQDQLALASRVAYPDLPGGEDGRYIFQGGHVYEVSAVVAAELTAAGYPAT
jgi:hypothetical protein